MTRGRGGLTRSLTGRLTLALAGFGGLATIILVVLVYARGRESILRDARVALDVRAREVATHLDRDLADRLSAIATWPALEAAQELAFDDVDKRLSLTLRELTRRFDAGDVALGVDPLGRVVAASDPSWLGARADTVPGVRAAEAHRESFAVSAGSRPVITLSRDVRRRNTEEFLGRLVLFVGADALVRSGIAPSALERLAIDAPDGRLFAGSRFSAPVPAVEGRAESTTFPDWHYTVLLREPQAILLAPIRDAQRDAVLLVASILAVLLPAALIVAGRATRSLRALSASAEAASGAVRPRLAAPAADAPDEVRVLSEALEAMIDRIEQARRAFVAREALASLGTMSAVLAHEIRTPLSVLRNAVELLQHPGDDEARRDELRTMVGEELDRLERLVTDLLAFARPRDPDRAAADLATLVQRIHPMLLERAATHRATIGLDLAPAPAVVDTDQVTQMLLNLVENAAQAAPGGVVTIRTRGNDGMAELVVEDDGHGIPAELLEQVWTPFITSRRTGTGLGLAIVRRIAEAHDGTAVLRSAPGQGTTVSIHLPSTPLP